MQDGENTTKINMIKSRIVTARKSYLRVTRRIVFAAQRLRSILSSNKFTRLYKDS